MHSKRVFLHVVTQGQAFCHIVVLPIPNISEFPTAEKSQKKACSPLKRLSLDVALFMLTFHWWKLRLLIVSNEAEESTLNCYSWPKLCDTLWSWKFTIRSLFMSSDFFSNGESFVQSPLLRIVWGGPGWRTQVSMSSSHACSLDFFFSFLPRLGT